MLVCCFIDRKLCILVACYVLFCITSLLYYYYVPFQAKGAGLVSVNNDDENNFVTSNINQYNIQG